ncbi:MAG: hypothetical protein WAU61_13550 [Smithella sp.]
MIDKWVREIKENCNPESLGMILVNNGIQGYGKECLLEQGMSDRSGNGLSIINVWRG